MTPDSQQSPDGYPWPRPWPPGPGPSAGTAVRSGALAAAAGRDGQRAGLARPPQPEPPTAPQPGPRPVPRTAPQPGARAFPPAGPPPAPQPQPGTGAARATRGASIVGAVPLLAVLAVAVAGVYVAWHQGSAGGGEGGVLAGAALLVGAAARLLLPPRLAGLLATRKRATDVLTLTALGVGLIVLGLVLPR